MINVSFPFTTDGRRTEDLRRREEESGGWGKMGKGAPSFPWREKCHSIQALPASLHLQPPCEPLQGDFSE